MFAIRRSATGIRSFAVRSSLDDFAVNLPAVITPGNSNLGVGPDNTFRWLYDSTSTPIDQLGSRVVLGGDFDTLPGPVTFRFYGWNAEASSGTFSLDNVYFIGSVEAVPEPAAGAWVAASMIGLGNERRRRSRARRQAPAAEPTSGRASRFRARPDPV